MTRERRPAALALQAPAKVNLFLEVLGKRPDGYHDLETLLVAVDLVDTLEFWPDESGALTLTCDAPGLTTGPDNLVLRAADRLKRHANYPGGAAIHLAKRIPMQAGLGGGSSDAAATLKGLNRVWSLGVADAELARLGAEIGSDVAFFFAPGAAWCMGRGEKVEPMTPGRPLDLVLVSPGVGLATADVFRRVTVPEAPVPGDAMRAAVGRGDVDEIGRRLHNRLQAPAEAVCPEVRAIRHALAAAGPAGCLMSGSGTTVFALCRDRSDAVRVARTTGADVFDPAPHDGTQGHPTTGPGRTGWNIRVVRSCV